MAEFTGEQSTASAFGAKPDWWDPYLPWPPKDNDGKDDYALYIKERDRYLNSQAEAQKKAEAAATARQVDTFPTREAAQRAADAASERDGKAYKVVKTKDGTAYTYEEVEVEEPEFKGMTEQEARQRAAASGGKLEAFYDSNTDKWKLRASKLAPLAAPEFVTGDDGNTWYRSEVDGAWQKVDVQSAKSRLEDRMIDLFTKGGKDEKTGEDNTATALKYYDFLNQPTALELADFALKAARSPADYFTIWAIARGEMPVADSGPFGRIAPNAQWLDAALARLFQFTTGSGLSFDETVTTGTKGSPTPTPSSKSFDQIQMEADATGQNLPRTQPGQPDGGVPTGPTPFAEEQYGYDQASAEEARRTGATPTPFAGGYPSGTTFPAEEGGGMGYTSPPVTPRRSMKGGEIYDVDDQPIPGTSAAERGSSPSVAGEVGTGPGGYKLDDPSPEATLWRAYAKSGQMPEQTPEQQLEDEIAALYKDLPFGSDATPEAQQARREAWVKENALRQRARGSTPFAPKATSGRSSGLQYDVDTLGTEQPRSTFPVQDRPTWMKNVYAGQTVAPVKRQYPAMGGPPFASPESLYNMLPSEREARTAAIEMQGIPWADYQEQEARTTLPTGRNYRRGRYIKSTFPG